MPQTLEPIIESSLLYTGEDGRQVFTHDTYRDFFAARVALNKIAEGELTFQEIHDRIGFTSTGGVNRPYFNLFSFLREVLSDDFNPPTLESVLHDEKLKELVTIGTYYGIGKETKLVIRIEDIAYCDYEGQMAIVDICYHLHKEYGVYLFCTEGGSGPVDFSVLQNYNNVPRRKALMRAFMEEGEFSGIEYFGVQNPVVVYGVEEKEIYSKLVAESKDIDSPHTHAGINERKKPQMLNTLKAMEEYNQDIAVLISGGGRGIVWQDYDLSPLVPAGASYVMMTPKVGKMNTELVDKILRGDKKPISEIVTRVNQIIEEENATNT